MRIGNIEVTDLRRELPANGEYRTRTLGDIDLLVVHHSGVDLDSSAWQIASYHRDILGWPAIGYHFLVHWDGLTEYVGDILSVRYHVGDRNAVAIGICLTGNFNNRPPNEVQLVAARELLDNLQLALGSKIPVVGHHEVMNTSCPGDTFIRKAPWWGEKLREEDRAQSIEGERSSLSPSLNPPSSTLNPINGLHWRNDPWSTEESDFRKFALGKFEWVMTICYPDLPPDLQARQLEVYKRLREINQQVKFVVRLNLSGSMKSSEFVTAFTPRLEKLREFTELFQIHNEPNHPGELFGGASDDSAWRYRWWHQRVVEGLKETVPWAKLGFPGLAVMQREEAWLDICAPAIEMSDFIGCHVYWQYDNWGSSDWGGRYGMFAKAFPTKDLYITEYGDSTPGRSAEQKARIYAQWLRSMRSSGLVKAACTFIVSSPDETWSGFALTEEACRIIGSSVTG